MSVVIIISALLLLIGAKTGIKEPVGDYIAPDATLALKGLFVVLVFFSHTRNYIPFSDNAIYDVLMSKTLAGLAQLVVVMFMFYSGYGIMTSIINKKDYARYLPARRLLPLLIKFDFAVSLYLIIEYAFGRVYPLPRALLALIGFESVGNSNWYIFLTFMMYVFCFVSFTVFKNRYRFGVIAVTVMTVLYIVLCIRLKTNIWWYDTIITFPLGMWYALYKEKIDRLTRKPLPWLAVFAVSFILFGVTWYLTKEHFVFAHARSIFFALTIVLATMRISPRNRILSFFGRHVFSIYILQRIPMIVLYGFFPDMNVYLFAALSLAAAILISVAFDTFIRPEALFSQKDN